MERSHAIAIGAALLAAVLVFCLFRNPEGFQPAFRFALTGSCALASDDKLRINLVWGPMQQTPFKVNILSPPIYYTVSGADAAPGGSTTLELSSSEAPTSGLITIAVAAVDRHDNVLAVEHVSVPNPFVQVAYPIPVFEFTLAEDGDAVILPDLY